MIDEIATLQFKSVGSLENVFVFERKAYFPTSN